MSIEQIKTGIDQLEQMLFFHSLQPLAMEELEQLQEKVKELKESFLETCFVGVSIEALEEIRFKLAEITYCIIISKKEQLHQNASEDVGKLESLYRTA
nr:hypothetical protein [Heyndrickxia oleronia]